MLSVGPFVHLLLEVQSSCSCSTHKQKTPQELCNALAPAVNMRFSQNMLSLLSVHQWRQVKVQRVLASLSAPRLPCIAPNIARCTTQHSPIHPACVSPKAQGMLGPIRCVPYPLFFLCFLGDATSLLYWVSCLGRSGSLS